MPARADQLEAIERWFMVRGTPHLMEDYSATGDVFTRMIPLLTTLALIEVMGAIDADRAWWQNVLAGIGGLLLLVALWAAVNALRGRRALTRPARVGAAEVVTFVVAPALITFLISRETGQAITLAIVNLVLLGGIYVITSYGLVHLTRWALGKTLRELGTVAGLLGRALPLLLLIQIVLFINTEMWQVADGFDGAFLAAVIVLFLLIGITFLLTRVPRELSRLATFTSEVELRQQVAGTPADDLIGAGEIAHGSVPLSRRQRGNVLLVALFSQGVQVILVTVILGAFYVAFGLLTITPEILDTWLSHDGDSIVEFGLLGREVQLTAELLKVSGFLAAFSGLYFTVVLVTDATYREEFFDEILAEIRQTLAVRAVYLRART